MYIRSAQRLRVIVNALGLLINENHITLDGNGRLNQIRVRWMAEVSLYVQQWQLDREKVTLTSAGLECSIAGGRDPQGGH